MLERVAGNLVDNAVKHSPAGGAIVIEVHSGEWAGLTIRDQGPGVPQRSRPNCSTGSFAAVPSPEVQSAPASAWRSQRRPPVPTAAVSSSSGMILGPCSVLFFPRGYEVVKLNSMP
jgi:hypothetical protein